MVPVQQQTPEGLTVKLVHMTDPNGPDDPIQAAFSVKDAQGNENIVTGECYSTTLYQLFTENGWIRQPTGAAGLRTIAGARRAS